MEREDRSGEDGELAVRDRLEDMGKVTRSLWGGPGDSGGQYH